MTFLNSTNGVIMKLTDVKKLIIGFHAFILLTSIFSLKNSYAADDSSDDSSSSHETLVKQEINFLNGREATKDGNYRLAIKYLLKAVGKDRKNADAYNLLGYSNRKLGFNDKAFDYYKIALKLDPRHPGVHEYIGELYLKRNELEKAKEHLKHLDSICFFGCEEYDDLKEAIENYEAK